MTTVVPSLDESSPLREHLETYREFISQHHNTHKKLHYLGDLDLVLREGREFRSVPWKTWGGAYRRGKERECFKNAFDLALTHPELTYVEGFASSGILPVLHAWCSDAEGRVVDPTWRENGREDVESWEYMGVPLDFDFVCEVTSRKATYGVFDAYDLYEEPLPPLAVAKIGGTT